MASAVSSRGIRVVAAEVGLSTYGVRGFLTGTKPYRPTLSKVLEWYASYGKSSLTEEIEDDTPPRDRRAVRVALAELRAIVADSEADQRSREHARRALVALGVPSDVTEAG